MKLMHDTDHRHFREWNDSEMSWVSQRRIHW